MGFRRHAVPDPESLPGEYSWGPGLTPKGLEEVSPSDGGMYRGKTPKTTEPFGLRTLADELERRGGA
ncbi:hypothetical protein F8M49_15665 [Rhodococcus zopfii]|uniref:Uncharacterized protein n=1 Tax=Rhodococcus zopfii TaxID=43772 RepID=A0ABU3WR00_9NOCA|nr:hypothetical protein [Rhodococcus zopfii]